MEKMKLFIGGSRDGKWHACDLRTVRFPVPSESPPYIMPFGLTSVAVRTYEAEEYELRFLRGRTKEFAFYVLAGID